jgi:hypothetical protein
LKIKLGKTLNQGTVNEGSIVFMWEVYYSSLLQDPTKLEEQTVLLIWLLPCCSRELTDNMSCHHYSSEEHKIFQYGSVIAVTLKSLICCDLLFEVQILKL